MPVKLKNYQGIFYSRVHENLLAYIIRGVFKEKNNELLYQEYSLLEPSQKSLILWIQQRIYPLLIWNSFWNWVEASKSLVTMDTATFINCLPFADQRNLPFFTFAVDKKDRGVSYFQQKSVRMNLKLINNCYHK